MTVRRLAGVLLTVGGAATVTACLAALSSGMRDVMQADGGFCASGGPYVIANQCSAGDVRLVTIGIMGGLVAAAVYVAGTGLLGRPASSAALVTWAALFGALGWNFISLGLRPEANQGMSSGWLFTGGTFWLMALGGLIPLLGVLVGDLKRADRRYPAYFGVRPLVRTTVLPGGSSWPASSAGGWESDQVRWPGPEPLISTASRRASTWRRMGIWLFASLAGTGLGLAATSSMIGALR